MGDSGRTSKYLQLDMPHVRARRQQKLRQAALLVMFVGVVVALIEEERRRPETRQAGIKRPRSDWDEHVVRSVKVKTFRRLYMMDVTTFSKLMSLLRSGLERNPLFAREFVLSILPVCVWYVVRFVSLMHT